MHPCMQAPSPCPASSADPDCINCPTELDVLARAAMQVLGNVKQPPDGSNLMPKLLALAAMLKTNLSPLQQALRLMPPPSDHCASTYAWTTTVSMTG